LAIPIEEIPDDDSIYYRVHTNLVKTAGGKLGPNCFRDPTGDGMSTDWSKYATPQQTRLAKGHEKAIHYGVTGSVVGRVRQIEKLTVAHAPIDDNDAHTHVLGLSTDDELLTMQRAELYEACGRVWLLEPGSPVTNA
jgi:hypothetical protein